MRDTASRLTDRDRTLVHLLHRHRVLTVDQIAAVLYHSVGRARHRLPILYRLRVVDRFQPHDPDRRNPPYHYVLDRVGAAIIAADDGRDPLAAARRHNPTTALGIARSQHLRHLVGTNWVYAALAGHARRHTGADLLDWWTEAECANWCGDVVRPDAYLRWREHDRTVEAFLEYDTGTEPHARLQAKLDAYARLESERGATAWVLLALPSDQRERNVRRALAHATVPVATAVLDHPPRPEAAVWRALHHTDRVRLADLDQIPKPLDALRRAAAGGARAWRFETARPNPEEVIHPHAVGDPHRTPA